MKGTNMRKLLIIVGLLLAGIIIDRWLIHPDGTVQRKADISAALKKTDRVLKALEKSER